MVLTDVRPLVRPMAWRRFMRAVYRACSPARVEQPGPPRAREFDRLAAEWHARLRRSGARRPAAAARAQVTGPRQVCFRPSSRSATCRSFGLRLHEVEHDVLCRPRRRTRPGFRSARGRWIVLLDPSVAKTFTGQRTTLGEPNRQGLLTTTVDFLTYDQPSPDFTR